MGIVFPYSLLNGAAVTSSAPTRCSLNMGMMPTLSANKQHHCHAGALLHLRLEPNGTWPEPVRASQVAFNSASPYDKHRRRR